MRLGGEDIAAVARKTVSEALRFVRALEFTAQYTISDRRYEDNATIGNRQKGQLLRLQLQVNY